MLKVSVFVALLITYYVDTDLMELIPANVCVLCVACRCLAGVNRRLCRVRTADHTRPRHIVVVTVAYCDVIGRWLAAATQFD